MNFRRPDVVIGTKDWGSVEGFLRNVQPDKMAEMIETHKYHVRIVLQSGERWYLNLLVSETARPLWGFSSSNPDRSQSRAEQYIIN